MIHQESKQVSYHVSDVSDTEALTPTIQVNTCKAEPEEMKQDPLGPSLVQIPFMAPIFHL